MKFRAKLARIRRRLGRLALLAASGAIVASLVHAAAIPFVPSTPQYSEASQIIATLNALINQLNGQTGFAPAQVVSLGSSCQPAAGGSPQTCNGQRGVVAFTGITVTTTGSSQTLVVNDTSVTAASACFAQWITAFTAGSALYVATVTPSAGSLSIVVANGGTTTNAVTTGTLAINCVA
jgi:hypothetical protein